MSAAMRLLRTLQVTEQMDADETAWNPWRLLWGLEVAQLQ